MAQKLKRLERLEVEQKIKSLELEVFTPVEFKDIFGVSLSTAQSFIKRNIKSGLLVKLRNGFYQLKDTSPSLYVVANKLCQPSYISLETALSYHGIIPETVYGITSVTTKPTKEFSTPRGVFSYQRVKRSVFGGYGPMQIKGDTVLIADSEKALADYLYFVDLKRVSLNDRLELRDIKKSQLSEYVKLFQRPSMLKLVNHIYAEYKKPRKIF